MQPATSPSAGDGHLDRGDDEPGLHALESMAQPTIRFENTSLIAQR